MGYYTYFKLGISKNQDELIDELRSKNENANDAIDSEGYSNNEAKWYNHEEDLKEFSKDNPGVVFRLEGDGEERDDLWVKYFYGGKVQVAVAAFVFEAFDINKLK